MLTVTYDAVKDLAARLAGRPPGKLPTSEAELLRDFIGDHLPRVHRREAWPESVMDFVAVTVVNYSFAKNEVTQGDLLSLYRNGNPQTWSYCERLHNWTEGNGTVRLMSNPAAATLYAEFQTPPTPLPDYGDAALGTTLLAERYKYVLARLAAAELVEDEDANKAERLRVRAEREMIEQASRFERPWWRRA